MARRREDLAGKARSRKTGTEAAVWVPAVLSLKMAGWDSLKGAVPSSNTFSLSSMLESEGQSKHCVLASQLHSQLAVTFQLFPEPRAASLSVLGHVCKDSEKGCAVTMAL